MKIRIKFSKHGVMKYIGHLDMMRYFQKAIRRADIDIAYSEGFSPHQIMSFAHPLGVGVESDGEYLDIQVHSTDSSKESIRKLNEVMADGVQVLSYVKLPDNAKNAMSIVAAADYEITWKEGYPLPCALEKMEETLRQFFAQDSIEILKKTKKSESVTDIKPWIHQLKVVKHKDLQTCHLILQAAAGSAANLKPSLFMESFYQFLNQEFDALAFAVTRKEVYANVAKEGEIPLLKPLCELGSEIE